jgi:hypothetical protein
MSGYRPDAGDIVYDNHTRLYGYVVAGAQISGYVTVALPTVPHPDVLPVRVADLSYIGPGFAPLIIAALA